MLKFILYVLIPVIITAGILWSAENNRTLLLCAVYPFAAFYAVALCGYIERGQSEQSESRDSTTEGTNQ